MTESFSKLSAHSNFVDTFAQLSELQLALLKDFVVEEECELTLNVQGDRGQNSGTLCLLVDSKQCIHFVKFSYYSPSISSSLISKSISTPTPLEIIKTFTGHLTLSICMTRVSHHLTSLTKISLDDEEISQFISKKNHLSHIFYYL